MNIFHPIQTSSAIIDIWWLFDDDGRLTLLLPYLLRCRRRWHLHVLHGLNKQPNVYETQKFDQLLQAWHENNKKRTENDESWKITETEVEANKEKIKRGLNLHEYLVEHSSKSSLIIVTLPISRKQSISPGLYLVYLGAISYNLPPLLFVGSNQKNVLTYYS
ncbi:unnamed protein product [Rotaria sp. Silwood2]|nr:unnamed protein product [Rotaria sp. Silwood2]CAF2862564.1 unnamed protein product [Rotaria sp. Silwood2]CAF2922550.1 unnamed protein product [Rotaria sp. Silwood2]CAF3029965.1 unnamed protein product [Rotaria sp. Silwood2]CAF4171475.1 unnamed protein product [Rotaria sp. Silwood2]